VAEWRKHYKSMWSDGTFCGLSRDARLLWNGLIDHADDEGYLKIDIKTLRVQIFPADTDLTDDNITGLIQELVDTGMLARRLVDKSPPAVVGCLPKWKRYQTIRPDRLKVSNLKGDFECGEAATIGCHVAAERQPTDNQRLPCGGYKIRREDRHTKDHAPSARPNEESEKPYNLDGYLCGMMRRSWRVRFKDKQHPRMDRLLEICRRRGLSPMELFKYTAEHFPDDPLKYIQSLTADGNGRFPENGEQTFEQWVIDVTSTTTMAQGNQT